FRNAIKNANEKLKSDIEFLLVDAFYIPFVKGIKRKQQLPVIRGDSLSISIAAASIIAKVARDEYMAGLSKQRRYKNYDWHKNKGYGTRQHIKAIQNYGITNLHRIKFVQSVLNTQQ